MHTCTLVCYPHNTHFVSIHTLKFSSLRTKLKLPLVVRSYRDNIAVRKCKEELRSGSNGSDKIVCVYLFS